MARSERMLSIIQVFKFLHKCGKKEPFFQGLVALFCLFKIIKGADLAWNGAGRGWAPPMVAEDGD